MADLCQPGAGFLLLVWLKRRLEANVLAQLLDQLVQSWPSCVTQGLHALQSTAPGLVWLCTSASLVSEAWLRPCAETDVLKMQPPVPSWAFELASVL